MKIPLTEKLFWLQAVVNSYGMFIMQVPVHSYRVYWLDLTTSYLQNTGPSTDSLKYKI